MIVRVIDVLAQKTVKVIDVLALLGNRCPGIYQVVVSHHAVSMDSYSKTLDHFFQVEQELFPIPFALENVLAGIAPVYHIMEGTWIFNPEWTGHEIPLMLLIDWLRTCESNSSTDILNILINSN